MNETMRNLIIRRIDGDFIKILEVRKNDAEKAERHSQMLCGYISCLFDMDVISTQEYSFLTRCTVYAACKYLF